MLTISKLKRWSINYYNDTANAAGQAAIDLQRANGGLGEYYSEHETRTPVWLLAGEKVGAARLVGLSDAQRAGGEADTEVVARWLDDGVVPNGLSGRAFGERGVHGDDRADRRRGAVSRRGFSPADRLPIIVTPQRRPRNCCV